MSTDDGEVSVRSHKRARRTEHSSAELRDDCPFLNTINRSALDFDLPPICSVTLVSHNVYACLVCGRFFRGRAPSSPAYVHALLDSHHLFINVASESVHCLPDDYIVSHPSLQDIKLALRPRFQQLELPDLDRYVVNIYLDGELLRTRGAVGLDTLHGSNSANVILQLFLRASPIRNALLVLDPHADPLHPVTLIAVRNALSQLCRKIWASHAFRSHISPHAFVQLFTRQASRQSFDARSDPMDVLAWLLNVTSAPKSKNMTVPSSIHEFHNLVKRIFLGEMAIQSKSKADSSQRTTQKKSTFWFLSLDLPPKPLFKHQSERDIVPQVALEKLLSKFNGRNQIHVVETGGSRSYQVLNAPPFLFLVIKRFTKSKFGIEKNPCVVHLPTDLLDVGRVWGTNDGQYRLIGTVSHEGSLEKGQFRVAILHEASNTWFDVSNVSVEQTVFHLVSLRDSYILLYERCSDLKINK